MTGLILPPGFGEPSKPKLLASKSKIPLSIWQQRTNELLYGGHGNPLDVIQTLGNRDPLLPQAYSADITARGLPNTLHEIGPGNFHMARSVIESTRERASAGFRYHCYDAYTASHTYHKDNLPAEVDFHEAGIQDFPRLAATHTPLRGLLVEVLDDTDTEHAAHHAGNDYLISVVPHMRDTALMESKALAAKKAVGLGQFTHARVLLAGGHTRETTYVASQIIHMIDELDLAGLRDVHPTFLRDLQYRTEADATDLYPILAMRFKDADGEYEPYLRSAVDFFREQLQSLPAGNSASFPLAGVRLLWDLRNHPDVQIDIFDYGYTTKELQKRGNPLSYSQYNGQITASVNFDVLAHAARELGLTGEISSIREYIRTHTGLDTISLSKLLYNAQFSSRGVVEPEIIEKLLRTFAFDKVVGIPSDEIGTPEKLPLNCRMQSDHAAVFVRDLQSSGLLRMPVDMSEGKYHLVCSSA